MHRWASGPGSPWGAAKGKGQGLALHQAGLPWPWQGSCLTPQSPHPGNGPDASACLAQSSPVLLRSHKDPAYHGVWHVRLKINIKLPKKGRKRGIKLKSCCSTAPHCWFLSPVDCQPSTLLHVPCPHCGGGGVCVCSVVSNSLWPTGLLCSWDSPGKNTGVGCDSNPPPGDLPDPGIEPTSPVLAGGFGRHSHLSHHQFPSPTPTGRRICPLWVGFSLSFPQPDACYKTQLPQWCPTWSASSPGLNHWNFK